MSWRWRTVGGAVSRGGSAAGCGAVALALVAGTSLPGVTGASVAAAQPMPLMMMVACVEAGDGGIFYLSDATEPAVVADRLPPQPAPSAALGVNRIRLIGTLEEFGVARHVGHKVWAQGLLIETGTQSRLNLVSITHLSPDCE